MGLPAPLIALEPIEAAERTRRQIALRLLPFLFLLYVTSFIDRTSVAFAALGMSKDLHLSDRTIGLAAGIFFLGYIALQIPGAILVERWSPRRAIAVVMIAWGCATALTGLIHTASQLYWARLVLGSAEAAFVPGVIVYLSRWFSRSDRAKATAYFPRRGRVHQCSRLDCGIRGSVHPRLPELTDGFIHSGNGRRGGGGNCRFPGTSVSTARERFHKSD